MTDTNYKFLKLLSGEYPDIASAAAEIIGLNAILNLPKGTEHFMSDIHGEYEAFRHILHSGSGVVRKKIDEKLGNTISLAERNRLATLIYYPEEKLALIKQDCDNLIDWYRITIYRLVEVCRYIASKYTRSRVRKSTPEDFAYIIDELLNNPKDGDNKADYYSEIVNSIITTDVADEVITALCQLISRLCIDRLHIVGDIFDRGPGAEYVMDTLCAYHSVDIQWGNHDILWMGAAAGSEACIANVVRLCLRYNNADTLEGGYGISLRSISTFAMEQYKDDPCTVFMPTDFEGRGDAAAIAKLNKAITVIQLKIEGQLIANHPEYAMKSHALFETIDFERGTIDIDGKTYELTDCNFPTVNPYNPNELTDGERAVVNRLKELFIHSERLQKHIEFLYKNGSMYTCCNGNIIYHGCIPMNENGDFDAYPTPDGTVSGKELLDYCDRTARKAYFGKDDAAAKDFMWYLWCGPLSPLYGRNKMTTFERCFIADKTLHAEQKNSYYTLYQNKEVCEKIIREFGLSVRFAHIINGHVPVRIKLGESPIKGGGKLLVIDGGLSKPYHKQTGIAGYTLIYNSYGLHLVTHEPFESTKAAIEKEADIHSISDFIEKAPQRMYIADTDKGREIMRRIDDLRALIAAYRDGELKTLND